ncbi:MAG: helix-turn-helix domain-containing protein [Ginsengibacter sp.]
MTVDEIISDAVGKLEEVTGYRIQIKVKKLGRLNNEANKRLKQLVSEQFGLTWETVAGKSAKHNVTDARKVYSWIARHLLEETLEDIGSTLNRKHTSAMFYIRAANDLIDINDPIARDIHFIKNKLIDEYFSKA